MPRPLSKQAPPESDTGFPACADGGADEQVPEATMHSDAHDAPAGHGAAQAGRAVSLSQQAPRESNPARPARAGRDQPQPLPKCR